MIQGPVVAVKEIGSADAVDALPGGHAKLRHFSKKHKNFYGLDIRPLRPTRTGPSMDKEKGQHPQDHGGYFSAADRFPEKEDAAKKAQHHHTDADNGKHH